MNTQPKILYVISLIPFILVLCTVFVVNPGLGNGIVSGKYFWFYVSMGLLSALSLQANPFRFLRMGLPDYLILVFCLLTLSVSYGINHSEAVTKHILLLLAILLYFYAKAFFTSYRQAVYWIVLFLMCTGLVEACWGLRQLYGYTYSQHGLFKLTGSFFNPGPYACYLSVILPIAFYYMIRDRNSCHVKFNLRRYWPVYLRWGISLVTVAGIVMVLPAAMSRASWLAGAGGCGLVAVCYAVKNGKVRNYYYINRKKCWAGLLLLSLFLMAGCIGMYYLKKDSADGRAFIWKNSAQMILHHPLGVGIGNFAGSYGEEQAAYFAAGRGTAQEEHVAGNPEYAFNEYLQICTEQGILPFLLFLGIMGYSLYTGIKRRRIAAAGSLTALLIAGAMSYPFSLLPFLIVPAFLLAWIHAGGKGSRISANQAILFNICGLLLVAGCLYNRYPTYQAYKKWKNYSFLYQTNQYAEASEKYESVYPQLSDQLTFLFEYAQALSKTERYEESNRVLEKAIRISCDPMLYNIMGKNYQGMKQYTEAEEYFLKSAHIVPHRIYPYYLLTNLFLETGDREKAIRYGTIVLNKEPKVQSSAVREMRENVKKSINSTL